MTDSVPYTDLNGVLGVYSTKFRPISGTCVASSNSTNATFGAPGEYEFIAYHSNSAATFSAAVSLQLSGGGTNFAFFAISPYSYIVRRIVVTEDRLVFQVSNGLPAPLSWIVQRVE